MAAQYSCTGRSGLSCVTPSRAGHRPTFAQWEQHRPLIERLYVDENWTLGEIQRIMQDEHGHEGTINMYKKRINKWKLVKNHKESEMVAIAHKKVKRDAIGKASAFVIRGKQIDIEEVLTYFRRKHRKSLEDVVARSASPQPSTPSDINCSTPIHSDVQFNNDDFQQDVKTSASFTERHRCLNNSTRRISRCSKQIADSWISQTMSTCRPKPLVEDQTSCYPSLHLVSSPLQPPDEMLIHERIFSNTENLARYSFYTNNRFSDFEERGKVVLQHGIGKSQPGALAVWQFQGSCNAAVLFLRRAMFVEARQMLARACEKIRDVLEQAHPLTALVLLRVYWWFKQEGYLGAGIKVFSYFRAVASSLTATNPNFCQIATDFLLVQDNLDDLYLTAGKRCLDTIEEYFEPFCAPWLTIRLGYIEDQGLLNGWQEAEKQTRDLLIEYKIYSGTKNGCYSILVFLARILHQQHKFAEAESVAQAVADAWSQQDIQISTVISALQAVAFAQYEQTKCELAQMSIEREIDLIERHYNPSSSFVIARLQILETWLQEWGEHGEAARVAARRSQLLGSPVIDELIHD